MAWVKIGKLVSTGDSTITDGLAARADSDTVYDYMGVY